MPEDKAKLKELLGIEGPDHPLLQDTKVPCWACHGWHPLNRCTWLFARGGEGHKLADAKRAATMAGHDWATHNTGKGATLALLKEADEHTYDLLAQFCDSVILAQVDATEIPSEWQGMTTDELAEHVPLSRVVAAVNEVELHPPPAFRL